MDRFLKDNAVLFWWIILFNLIYASLWHKFEMMGYHELSKGLANPAKVRPLACFARLLFIVTAPYFLLFSPEFKIYDRAFFILFMFTIFLNACDPLPPCKGKVKEWLASFGKKPTLAVKTEE